MVLNRLERYSEAIAVFDKLIVREPGDYSHWNNAANLYKDIGRLAKADEYYQRQCRWPGARMYCRTPIA